MPFDPAKPIQLRNGKPARVLATDIAANGELAIAIAYRPTPDREEIYIVHSDGSYYDGGPHPSDAVNIPDERVAYINIYPQYISLGRAREKAQPEALGQARVTTVDGKLTALEIMS